ncbi:MAG: aspartate aminotransferase family protein [Proteobacteria bacterium]|nr:aspartate aminotransferase family protein [Pseudomonadota bacterium]
MSKNIIKQSDQVIAKTYARFPIVFEKGSGCTLWDSNGKAYLDFVAGIAVCNLGHAHPGVAKAISEQAEKLVHVSNLYYTIPQTELATLLTEKSFADRVFFANSGAEANEASIKLARKYYSDKGEKGRHRIITMEKSFHGRTMATLTATGQDKIKQGFSPVLEGFDYVPFNDIEALKSRLDPSVTCAVMLEPVQGEGGIRVPAPDYLKQVRKLCDDTGTLLIFDEIQTGLGRTGKLFAYEHFGIAPDIMTLAKALGNGLPIGAMLAKDHVMEAFGPGSHASTFGGTPLVCAAALEVVKILSQGRVIENGRKAGAYFKEQLMSLKEKYNVIEDVRGIGLLLGLKLKIKGVDIVKSCYEKGFIINCIQDKILRFIPPLVIATEEIDRLVECLDDILGKLE